MEWKFLGVALAVLFLYGLIQRESNLTLFKESEVFHCVSDNKTQTLRLASWNIQHLGRRGSPRTEEDIGNIARILALFDFVAIQELLNKEGLKEVHNILEKITGTRWGFDISHKVGRGRSKEKYAFLWQKELFKNPIGGVLYTEDSDAFIREPFSAVFKAKQVPFVMTAGNIHILHGGSIQKRANEIHALTQYWNFLESNFEARPILLFGDFNLWPQHRLWNNFRQFAIPLITEGRSTLSTKEGEYANLYDNIWMSMESHLVICESGILLYPELLNMDHATARRSVSDHAPVFVTFQFENN